MDRRTRTFIVIAVALVAATVASAVVYRAVKAIPVREVEVAHHFVLVTARPLALGTRLAAADLKRVGWPSSSPLAGSFARVEDVIGRAVVTPLAANEPLSESKLAPREAGAGLPPAIPPGMRAISVKVNDVIGVAGFATPGAHVDVMATVRRNDDAITRVLVSNVPVLTVGTRLEQEQPSVKPLPATVVTLLVTPSQAEQIALASSEGQIALTLRNPLDLEDTVTPGARLGRLVQGTSGTLDTPEAPAATPVRTTRPPVRAETPAAAGEGVLARGDAQPYLIEAIRAGKRTQEVVE